MIRIVVMGHGGYAEGVKQNLDMIIGHPAYMYFVDLTKEDDLAAFEKKVNDLLESFSDEDQVMFACDLLGASPFRIAAMKSAGNPDKYHTVAGLNAAALLELCMESDLSIEELINRAVATTKDGVKSFPN